MNISEEEKKHKGGKFVQWFTLHIKSNTNNQETCGLWIQMSFISLYNLLHVVLSLSLSLSSYSWFSEGCPFDVGLSVAVPEHSQKMELVSIFFMYLSASSVRKSNFFFCCWQNWQSRVFEDNSTPLSLPILMPSIFYRPANVMKKDKYGFLQQQPWFKGDSD